MKRVFFLFLITTFLSMLLFADEPILQLDTGGHTGKIEDIITTKSSDIISVSVDKTIRVWDGATGREKRKILGEIGAGPKGLIFAIALSPDGEYLAAGGFLVEGHGVNDDLVGTIRIYHYPTGKLIKVLKSHTNVVLDLSFSQDGRYLISGSGDTTAKIWDVSENFTLKDTIAFHSNVVYAVRIIQKGSRYFAVTAGYDNQIALYDMQKREVVKSQRSKYNLQFLAIADNLFNGRIAVCGVGKEITIYDFNLKFIKKVKSETVPTGLAYSPNGKLLIAGAGSPPGNVNIYQSKNNYRKKTSFKKHTNLTMAVGFLDNHTAVSAGGNNSEIYIWNANTTKVYQKIVGAGEQVWSVGIRGDRIAWGNMPRNVHQNNSWSIQKSIDLKNFSIDTRIRQNSFKRIPTRNGSYSLSHSRGGEYGKSDAILNIKKNGRVTASIVKDSTNGYRHRCYGWYKEYIISGGNGGNLKIYNKEGKEVANLIGHTGEVWSIAIDGDRLVSGSGDQTIRVWNLSEIENKSELRPMLNLFISKNNEWVIWTPSGYYAASPKGDAYVGYHINRGPDKEAYFVSSAKYYDKLYRPDIIQAVIETGSEKRAIEKVSVKRKVKQADIVKEMPPIVTLLGSSHLSTGQSTATIKFDIQSGTPITKYIITRNGEKLRIEPTGSGSSKTLSIDLDEGENLLSIRAKNKYVLSDEILVTVTRESHRDTAESTDTKQTEANLYKPTLYLLSIGVSKYKNSDYNLEVADKDAKSIVEIFKKQEGKIFKKVVVKELINQDATKDNILDALEWIERETTQRDMVIIFVAGHGINDDKGNYYYMAYDSDVEKLRRSALRWIEIKDTLSDLPSKVILMVDTCHSGNIMGQERRRDLTGAIKSIINSGTGSVIMTASTGRGYSIENKSWGHGAFTKAMIEGLGKAKADYNNNNTISIKEIDLYVTDRVKELTKGKQKPTTIIPDSSPDFALGVKQ